MDWNRLISDKRLGLEQYHDPKTHTRSDFQRDYDRLIFSSPFRRLQNKTQVFPLPGSIFVHNRLTHSLEVSSVGRSMANEVANILIDKNGNGSDTAKLRDMADIVATACLAHDLGNPPFGHNGEKSISSFFTEGAGLALQPLLTPRQWSDFAHFEGNANSFRLLTHQFEGRRKGGYAMTYSALASVVKYPFASTFVGEKGKFGYFETEEEIYLKVAEELGIPEIEHGRHARHPFVFLMEAADDICYQIMDIEDAHKLKILSTAEVKDLLLNFFGEKEQTHMIDSMNRLDDPNEQVGYMRSKVIGALVGGCSKEFTDHEAEILAGDYFGSLTSNIPGRLSEAYAICSETAWEKIYNAPEVVDIEIAGNRIITYLMENLVGAVVAPEKAYSKLLLAKVPKQYDVHSDSLNTRLQGVVDHVSAMTDVYALDLFRTLNGHTLPAV
ncbi:MAG: dNTP triphosphohydrolase [Muribaculaceae bacterium]|nr:dNTP triphosphohydrolase [Muribaculaceae bacterium]MDE6523404.1 dNTP triphosphohydrolase [Muribaculaceae bacterium]